ncbi:MAG: DUF493 domain-containing protein [Pseudogulbenkiania sp.]|nr:DUF493 domain-containing protein [Pseudogulbenkiania sp.]
MSNDLKDLLDFPCRFPIKVMGEHHPEFHSIIYEVVRVHAPDLEMVDIVARDSSSGKYISLTVSVMAVSREQLDSIYMALTAHAMVKVAL